MCAFITVHNVYNDLICRSWWSSSQLWPQPPSVSGLSSPHYDQHWPVQFSSLLGASNAGITDMPHRYAGIGTVQVLVRLFQSTEYWKILREPWLWKHWPVPHASSTNHSNYRTGRTSKLSRFESRKGESFLSPAERPDRLRGEPNLQEAISPQVSWRT